MKISINTDDSINETVVSITCNGLTPEIEKMISVLRMLDMQITGMKDGETYLMDTAEILYIDTTDKKTFLYTGKEVYETNLHLYELEDQLSKIGFVRANKSCIVNLRHIVSLRADLDRKIRVTLSNGEKLLVSRQYSDSFKKKLGVK